MSYENRAFRFRLYWIKCPYDFLVTISMIGPSFSLDRKSPRASGSLTNAMMVSLCCRIMEFGKPSSIRSRRNDLETFILSFECHGRPAFVSGLSYERRDIIHGTFNVLKISTGLVHLPNLLLFHSLCTLRLPLPCPGQ